MTTMNTDKPVALITGGTKRIGAAIARDLAHHGFTVALHYRTWSAEAEETLGKIESNNGTAHLFQADLLKTNGRGLIEDVTATLGAPRLIINNASLFLDDTLDNLDETTWNNHFKLHLQVPINLAAAMKRMLPDDQKGLIINMIDQRVLKPNPKFLSYTLSKSALWNATQTLAQAMAPQIRVNAIGPGPSLKSPRQNPEDFEKQSSAVLLGHGPKIEEFGKTILYLWQAESITGQMIALDGGQHLMWQTPDLVGLKE